MKIIPNYNNSVTVIPSGALLYLSDASKEDLAVLLAVLNESEFDIETMSEKLNITADILLLSLHFWEEHGIISIGSDTESQNIVSHSEKKSRKKQSKKQGTTLPSYTTEETARFLETNDATAVLLDSCQQILGKIFSTAETSIIIGLLDHLSLDTDYILLLCAHAAKNNRKSVRYIEKLAISLFDKGITSYSALVEELRNIEDSEKLMSRVRKIFGTGKRALTSKEKDFIYNWCIKWNYDEDIIRRAYEITVNSTNEPSFPYTNAILENWYANDLKTIEEIDAFLAARNAEKSGESELNTSFDTDDFFEAALQRSYGEED